MICCYAVHGSFYLCDRACAFLFWGAVTCVPSWRLSFHVALLFHAVWLSQMFSDFEWWRHSTNGYGSWVPFLWIWYHMLIPCKYFKNQTPKCPKFQCLLFGLICSFFSPVKRNDTTALWILCYKLFYMCHQLQDVVFIIRSMVGHRGHLPCFFTGLRSWIKCTEERSFQCYNACNGFYYTFILAFLSFF